MHKVRAIAQGKQNTDTAGARFTEKAFLGYELESTAEQLLKDCDWCIDYSDSMETRRKEYAKQSLMHQILALLERRVAITLWETYSPHNRPDYLN